MTLYTFRQLEKLSRTRDHWDFYEFQATVSVLTTETYAIRAVTRLTHASIGAWKKVTELDGRTRAIGTRAISKLGTYGFVWCLRQARRELGLV